MAATSSPVANSQLDVVFDGTWMFFPSVDSSGNIVSVDVYSPACGHPHAALFLPQPGPFGPTNWPQLSSFYMVDNHGLNLFIQSTGKGMPLSGIDQSINHYVPNRRPIGGNWDLIVSIHVGPNTWVSTGTQNPVTTDNKPCFSGGDIPKAKISSIQTLSFQGVTAVAVCGAPTKLQSLIPSPYQGPGTLIFEGEVPYIPTLQHERSAITAMANLGGLDLLLEHPLPSSGSSAPGSILQPRVAGSTSCGHGIILSPG